MNFFSKWRSVAKFDFDNDRYQPPIGGTTFKREVFRLIHGHDPDDVLTRYMDRTIAVFILVSVILDSFLDIQNSPKFLLPLVNALDWFVTITLTLEMFIKWLTVDLDPRLSGLKFKRLRFLLRPMSLLDLLILALSWISLFLPWHLAFVQFMRLVRLTELVHPVMNIINVFIRETRGYTLRRRFFSAFFGGDRDHGIPGLIDFTVFGMIMLSVLLMTLESVDWMAELYKPKFDALDTLVTICFILEYLARVYCCVEDPKYRHPIIGRLRYIFTWGAIIDLVSIAPFFLGLFWTTTVPWLWALRLVRMLKLARYSKSISTISAVIQEERAVLSAAVMMLFLLTLFAASGIYVMENAAQPDKFSSIPVSMYWAVITLTTIGYGDYYPITPLGKLLTMFLAVAGLGMIALPAGILANGFSQKIKTSQKSRHRDALGHFSREGDHSSNGPSGQSDKPHDTQEQGHLKFSSIDQVLRSEEATTHLNHFIHSLSHAEKEALIALTAISLRQDDHE